jgi:hypothetical protein
MVGGTGVGGGIRVAVALGRTTGKEVAVNAGALVAVDSGKLTGAETDVSVSITDTCVSIKLVVSSVG